MNLPSFKHCEGKSSWQAFTLVELLAAMGVTALLMTFMLGTVSQVLGVWSRANGALSTRAQADLIFEQLVRDLESAVMRKDGNVWFAVTVQPSPQPSRGDAAMSDAVWDGLTKPGNDFPGAPGSSLQLAPSTQALEAMRFGQAGMWLRFFTTAADTNTNLSNLSAPRAVAYQLVRRRITASASATNGPAAPIRYGFYRSSARPMSPGWPDANSTFATGYDLFSDSMTPHYSVADSSQIDQVGNIRSPRRYEQILANNVIDFGLRCWQRGVDENWVQRFPATDGSVAGNFNLGYAATTRDGIQGPAASPPPADGGGAVTAAEMTYGFPERIEVMVRILTDEGARLLEAFESGKITRPAEFINDGVYWWEIALRHSHVFTRSIRVFVEPI